jgi:hypothetical protein
MPERELSRPPDGTGPLHLRDFVVRQVDGLTEVSADVDGFRLRFRVPDAYEVSKAGDAFLACALLPAMATGRPLVVEPELPVSAALLRNIATLQEIFHSWNPGLRVVSVSAETCQAHVLNAGGMSFFSGGVDSTYTLLKNIAGIDRAVFIQGFDFKPADSGLQSAVKRNSDLLGAFGVELLPVETNHYEFGYRYNLSRNLTHGSILGAVALLLGFKTAYVPSSGTYSRLLPPLGSHPLTDPLWSNEAVSIVHDGCEAGRTTKLRSICVHEAVRTGLHVCLKQPSTNCGKCEKCLRTMVSLRVLQLSIPALPPLPSLASVWKGVTRDPYTLDDLRETYLYACELEGAENRALRAAIRGAIRTSDWVRIALSVDDVLLGGAVQRAYEGRKNPKGRLINTHP